MKKFYLLRYSLLLLGILTAGSFSNNLQAQVLIDAHSSSADSATWTITTSYPNELILIAACGYSVNPPVALSTAPGTVTVNGNNAAYETMGLETWYTSFAWTASIWAYQAAVPGTYTCVCTEAPLNSLFYENFATSVYQVGLPVTLGDVIIGGNAHSQTNTGTASITTTLANSYIFGVSFINDNNGTGTVSWTGGGILNLDHQYVTNGIDANQAGVTEAAAGTYNITVTDAGASNPFCAMSLVAVQPNNSPCTLGTSAFATNNILCNGGINGAAAAYPVGGTAPYTYSWAPAGGNNSTATGLSAGSYTVTVTDAGSCTAMASVNITQPSQITITSTSSSDVSCFGDVNGYENIFVTGGAGPYSYLWNPSNATSSLVSGLSAGTYTVTVTDNVGCTGTAAFTISQPSALAHTTSMTTNATCITPNGTAGVTESGGTAPYQYSWSPGGQTTATITGLNAGSYQCTVRDVHGCIDTFSVIVTGASGPTLTLYPTPDSSGCNGYILSTVTGGTPPYTYLWSPGGQTTAVITGLCPGSYCCVVMDANGCQTSNCATVASLCSFAVTLSSTPVSCNNNGTATAIPAGGIPPYTYSWTPGGGTTATITGLPMGIYSVTVFDSNGCMASGSISVSSAAVSYTISGNPTTITPGNYTLLTATCNAPATYLWAPPANVTNPNVASSYANPPVTTEYTVTITTACGTYIDSVLITVSCFNLSMTSTSSYCASMAGTATVTASAGIPPYTYLWAPGGQTTSSISGITAGTYTVTVKDSSGCSVTHSVSVAAATITYSASGNPLYVNAGDSTLLTAHCNIPATYSWAPSSSVTNPNSSSTYAHPPTNTEYTVTITTACGSHTDSVLINIQCFPLTMSSTPNYTNCTSSYDGTATVTPGGGTPPYTYLWTPGGKTTATITGLYPGNYSVLVHDHTGCSSSESVSVSSATASLTVDAFPPTITLGDSSYLSASFPFPATYAWAPSAGLSCTNCPDPMASPSVTTTYTVTITDTCGVLTDTVTVYVAACANNYNEPICIVTVDTANHPVIIWGRTNSPPQGGYGSYIVYMENSSSVFVPIDNQPLNVLSDYVDAASNPGLGPISYKLATDDSCGESALSPVHTTIFLTMTNGVNVNILNWTAYVGFTPSKYRIYRGLSMSTMVQIDSVPSTILTYHDTLPPAGAIYIVEAVNPSSSCIPTTSIRHHNSTLRMLSGSYSNGSNKAVTTIQPVAAENVNLNIYPNPSNGSITIEWSGSQSSLVRISMIDELGRLVYDNSQTQTIGDNKKQLNLENLSSGIYSLRMQTDNNITVKKVVIMKK